MFDLFFLLMYAFANHNNFLHEGTFGYLSFNTCLSTHPTALNIPIKTLQ